MAQPAVTYSTRELVETPTEKVPKREHWSGRLDFFFSALGFAVGLGNVWAFPYLCFKYGGGAFLVPYFTALFLIAIPMFLVELAIGQYSGLSPIKAFSNLCPAFSGLGISTFISSMKSASSYIMIITWSVFYLGVSFSPELPWQFCGQDYNTNGCFNDMDYKECKRTNESLFYNHGRCFYNMTEAQILNITEDVPKKDRVTAAEEYMVHYVLGVSSGIDDFSNMQWRLVIALAATWLLTFLCVLNGIKTSGKVVYVTATLPYLIMTVLIGYGLSLPGGIDGIKYFLLPDWSKVMNFKVWEQACVQVMGSLSLGAGGLVTLASYNNYDYNLVRDTLVIGLGNSLTSMYAGLAIFSSLGYMARELGVKIEDVARDGTALAFIAYPNLVLHMPWPMLWAVLFFIMLITLGLDSEFAIIENITTNLQDIYPQLRNHKKKLTGTVCFLGFLLGLIFCNGVGSYIMNFMDYYGNAPRFILTEYLCIGAVLYSLGIDKFYEALNSMVGFRVNSWYAKILKVIYLFVIPLYFAIIFILAIFYSKPLSVRDYAYPPAARWIGWLLAMVPISAVPYMFFKRLLWDFRGLPTWKDRWRALFTPTSRWYENHHKFIEGKIPTDGYFKNGETNLAFQENQQFSANVGLPPKHTLNSSIKNLTGPNVLEQYRSNLAADSKDTRL